VTCLPSNANQTKSTLIGVNSCINYQLGLELLKFEESLSRLKVAYNEFTNDEEITKINNHENKRRHVNSKQKKKLNAKKDEFCYFENLLKDQDSEFKRTHDLVFDINQ